jgi:DNA-binding transcriptional MocR family regulator
LLNSPADLEHFITTNQQELADAYAYATQWLQKRQIPYRAAEAGHFIWINLRSLLGLAPLDVDDFEDSEKQDREWDLLAELVDHGLYLGPGQGYHSPTIGMFRLTFSIPRDDLKVALERLEQVIEKRKR